MSGAGSGDNGYGVIDGAAGTVTWGGDDGDAACIGPVSAVSGDRGGDGDVTVGAKTSGSAKAGSSVVGGGDGGSRGLKEIPGDSVSGARGSHGDIRSSEGDICSPPCFEPWAWLPG